MPPTREFALYDLDRNAVTFYLQVVMPGGKMGAFRLQRPGGRSRVLPKRRSFIDAVTGRPQRNFQRNTSGMCLAVAIRE